MKAWESSAALETFTEGGLIVDSEGGLIADSEGGLIADSEGGLIADFESGLIDVPVGGSLTRGRPLLCIGFSLSLWSPIFVCFRILWLW